MKKNSSHLNQKNIVVIYLILVISGMISWYLYFKEYRQVDTVKITDFPKSIGGWISEEMTLTEDEYAILETHNVVARKYSTSGKKPIYLLLVYSQYNRKVSHPPEVCYTGSGMTILENKHDSVSLENGKVIQFNRLLLELKDNRQFSAYWFKVGDSFTPNYWKQQFLIAAKTLIGKPHSSALIRISVDFEDKDELTAIDSIKNFTQLIYEPIIKYLP